MTEPSLGFAVVTVTYALCGVFPIKIREDVEIPMCAVLAPSAALSALPLSAESGVLPLVIPGLLAAVVVAAWRRSLTEAGSHALLYCLAALSIRLGTAVGERWMVVLAAVLAVSVYASGESWRLRASSRRVGATVVIPLGMESTTWWLVLGVLACASGLTVLVTDVLRWPVVLAMAGVLALTRREFQNLARSRIAYEQTIRALRDLEAHATP